MRFGVRRLLNALVIFSWCLVGVGVGVIFCGRYFLKKKRDGMIEGHASAGEGFGLDDSDDMMNLSVSVDGEEDDFGDTDGLLSGNVGDDPENANGSGDNAPAKQQFGLCGWTTVAFYRSYFDVDTDDVKERLKRALMPWKRDF